MRYLAVLAVLVAATALPGAAAPRSDATPRLVLVDRSPLAVRGLRFKAGESVRVRVVVRGGPRAAKTVLASPGGAFNARFASVWPGRCSFVTVVATGAQGSRATFTQHPPLCGADL